MSELVLGLGLFFLGMQMVGENLRRLSGASFQQAMLLATKSPAAGALTGTIFGALMQSATAVTFISVSMYRSGTVTARGALPVILFCNVGLTALAFITSLNIHPAVAWLVGLSGIGAGMLRKSTWNAFAGFLLGLGLILFGLESIGEGAKPLEQLDWFRAMLDFAGSSPVIGFVVGFAAAAILQSNTGATMLVITLAAGGSFTLEQAAPIIYGTNLGAIVLRAFLALSLDGPSIRLVRFEDLFCVVGGVVLMACYFVELAGVPLLGALVGAVTSELSLQLALLFLFSNLLPALLLFPFRGAVLGLLERVLPEKPDPNALKYLTGPAVRDPASAIVLERKELGHLFSRIEIGAPASEEDAQDSDPSEVFAEISGKIESFNGDLLRKNDLTDPQIAALQQYRGVLSLCRFLEETVRDLNQAVAKLLRAGAPQESVDAVTAPLEELLTLTHDALHRADPDLNARLRDETRRSGPKLAGLRAACAKLHDFTDLSTHRVIEVRDNIELVCWILHRVAKILQRLDSVRKRGKGGGDPA